MILGITPCLSFLNLSPVADTEQSSTLSKLTELSSNVSTLTPGILPSMIVSGDILY